MSALPRFALAHLGALLGLVLLAGPATASTATVRPGPGCDKSFCDHEAAYEAGPREENDVTVSRSSSTALVIADPGAVIRPGEGCTRIDDHTVSCTDREPLFLTSVSTGDLADRASVEGPVSARMAGGTGDDVLRGGDGGARISGGSGTDTLLGGAHDDFFSGGDEIDRGPAEADSVDGGGGTDTMSYASRREGVFVNLAANEPQGATGEGDLLTNIEAAIGGRGDDSLFGDIGDNNFDGGRGDDLLQGFGGNDALNGDIGADDLRGGAGDDSLNASASSFVSGPAVSPLFEGADRVSCGDGNDGVADVDLPDFVAEDCERFPVFPFAEDDLVSLLPLRSARGGVVAYRFSCFGRPSCRYRMTLRAAAPARHRGGPRRGTLLGETRIVSSSRERPRRRVLRLSPKGARLLRRHRRLRVRVFVSERLGAARAEGRGYTTLLRAP